MYILICQIHFLYVQGSLKVQAFPTGFLAIQAMLGEAILKE